ncbi:hypothetical protein AVEN_3717-1, partial [Araneus ventricosus]
MRVPEICGDETLMAESFHSFSAFIDGSKEWVVANLAVDWVSLFSEKG